jgi:hypothetical protein
VAALDEWLAYRQRQGCRLAIVSPGRNPAETADSVRAALARLGGERPFVLLVGSARQRGLEPFFVRAEAIDRFGPEGWIATDHPYGDTSGRPAAVGRAPLDDPSAIRRYLARVTATETRGDTLGDAELRLAAGEGGFGPLADAAIEGAARSALNTLTPHGIRVQVTRLGSKRAKLSKSVDTPNASTARAWVYLGHGTRDALVPTISNASAGSPVGRDDDDASTAAAGADLALLVACYGAAIDSHNPCVGERMMSNRLGPTSVIGATRVSMPYGNAVVASRLLVLSDSSPTVGEWLAAARSAALKVASDDTPRDDFLRAIRGVAQGMSPGDASLAGEVRDHAAMYVLLGDPLQRIRPIRPSVASSDLPTPTGGLR